MSRNTFELRRTILLCVAIVYGCKIMRSQSQRIKGTLLKSSFADVMKIVQMVVNTTRE